MSDKPDPKGYLEQLRKDVDALIEQGHQVDFADAVAADAYYDRRFTKANAIYWLHVSYVHLREQLETLSEGAATYQAALMAVQAEREKYRTALEAVQAHHRELNEMAGRPESASTTLSIIREALQEGGAA